jgi:hypothetical protein
MSWIQGAAVGLVESMQSRLEPWNQDGFPN